MNFKIRVMNFRFLILDYLIFSKKQGIMKAKVRYQPSHQRQPRADGR